MPTSHTTRLALRLTRLALDVDRLARQLAAEEHIDTESLVPGAIYLLATAVEELEVALYRAEKLDQSHRAEDLPAARAIAYPHLDHQAA